MSDERINNGTYADAGNEETSDEKVNVMEKAGVVDDDILGQVADVGKTTLEIGKKTLGFGLKAGKLLFNVARVWCE